MKPGYREFAITKGMTIALMSLLGTGQLCPGYDRSGPRKRLRRAHEHARYRIMNNDLKEEQRLCLIHWTRALRCVLKGEWQEALEYHASAECPVDVLFPKPGEP